VAESQWEIVGFTVVAAGPARVAIFPFGVSLAWLLARRSWPGKLPLLVRGTRIALEAVSPRLEQVATTLGASPLRVFMTITLPLAIRGIIAGGVLAFARALGEFGATSSWRAIFLAGRQRFPPRSTAIFNSDTMATHSVCLPYRWFWPSAPSGSASGSSNGACRRHESCL
jgi:ABC-type molybdate transport system permease subunit